MTYEQKSMEMLEGFQSHFNYDTSYMKEMLTENSKAFETFEAFLPMSTFVDKSPKDVIFVARLTSMKNEDCGACLQLNVDMATEAGVDKEIIQEVIFNEGKNLSSELKMIYDFTLCVGNKETVDAQLYEKMNKTYAKEVIVEIGLAIAATKVFPTLKRVLNDIQSCASIQINVK